MNKLETTPDLIWILGQPSFACCNLAQLLRSSGQEIPCKAEQEQAAVILWMLNFYLADQANWRQSMEQDIKRKLTLLGVDTTK